MPTPCVSPDLEKVVGDALRYLGFQVKELGQAGEPEGIASAYTLPTSVPPTADNPNPPLYSFTYDAKASKHETAATNNINHAGVVEHRTRYNADHALVVAPGYQDGAMATRCEQQQICAITAKDLGRLLEYTVEHGAIPVTKLREMLTIYNPADVETWVTNLESWIREKRPLTIDIFLAALEGLKDQVPDALAASTIALQCRTVLQAKTVVAEHVLALAQGLSILVPDLVAIDGDKVIVNASSTRVAAAVSAQLDRLRGLGEPA